MKTYRLAFALVYSASAFYLACSDSESTDSSELADASAPRSDSAVIVEDAASESTDATTTSDDGSSDASAPSDGSALGDSSLSDAAEAAAPVAPASLLSLSPETLQEGSAFTVCVTGLGIAPTARILVNGSPATPATPDGGTTDAGSTDAGGADAGPSPTTLCASSSIAANLLGLIPVQIENAPGDLGSLSNTLFVDVAPSDGGLEVFDLQPDNGPVGTVVKVIGLNLGSSVTITDPQNVSVTASPADGGGSMDWPDRPTSQYATFTIPAGWHSGPVTVSSGGKTFRARTFNVGTNLSPTATFSGTEYPGWPFANGADNNLATSWFAVGGACASDPICTQAATYTATFSSPKAIARIALRGNREYSADFDIKRARVEIRGAVAPDAGTVDGGLVLGTLLYSRDLILPSRMRDIDVQISPPVAGSSVRIVSLEDDSPDPGFAELEVFEN